MKVKNNLIDHLQNKKQDFSNPVPHLTDKNDLNKMLEEINKTISNSTTSAPEKNKDINTNSPVYTSSTANQYNLKSVDTNVNDNKTSKNSCSTDDIDDINKSNDIIIDSNEINNDETNPFSSALNSNKQTYHLTNPFISFSLNTDNVTHRSCDKLITKMRKNSCSIHDVNGTKNSDISDKKDCSNIVNKNNIDNKNHFNHRDCNENSKDTDKIINCDKDNCNSAIKNNKDEVMQKATEQKDPAEKTTVKKAVYIVGDSMIKEVKGYELSKSIRLKKPVKVRSHPSAHIRCLSDHVKPVIRNGDADHVILHIGTNDLRSEKTPVQICHEIIDLATSIKNENIKVSISGLVQRGDGLNEKVLLVNEGLSGICEKIGMKLINHKNIRPDVHLNASKLHLNKKGNSILISNFRRFLSTLC